MFIQGASNYSTVPLLPLSPSFFVQLIKKEILTKLAMNMNNVQTFLTEAFLIQISHCYCPPISFVLILKIYENLSLWVYLQTHGLNV